MPKPPVLDPEEIAEEKGFDPTDAEDTAEAVERLMGMKQRFQDEQQEAGDEDKNRKEDSKQGPSLQDAKDAAKDAKGLADKFGGGAKAAGRGGQAAGEAYGATGGTAAGTAGGSAAGSAGGAAAGTAGGAAAGAGGGAAAGATAGSVVPGVGTAIGAVVGAAASKLAKPLLDRLYRIGKKAVSVLAVFLIGSGLTSCGCLLFGFLAPVFILFLVFLPLFNGGAPVGEAAGFSGSGTNSKLLTVRKTASVTNIPRNAVGATVTYTITVRNLSTSEATGVTVNDLFASAPDLSLAGDVTGYEVDYSIGTLGPTGVNTKTFTIFVPHTDFDPGWVLFNTVTVTGTIDGNTEVSQSGTSVLIGDPPSGPPAYSPLKGAVYRSGYYFGQPQSYGPHAGTDIASDNYTVYSPFAQGAVVTFAGGVRHCPSAEERATGITGYGLNVLIRSGEWEVRMAHLDSISVSTGQTVTLNTIIGIMGNTGCSGGDHVHYEVRHNGALVDPENYNALNPHP